MGNHGYSMDPNAYPDPDQDQHPEPNQLPDPDRLDGEVIVTIHDIISGLQAIQENSGPINVGAEYCLNHAPMVTAPLATDPEQLITIQVLAKGSEYSSSMGTSWRCCSNCAVAMIMRLARTLHEMGLLPAPAEYNPQPPPRSRRSRRHNHRIPKS